MPKATCSVPGCDRPATARKMCEGHRARWRKRGDVQADVPLGTRQPRTGHCSVEGCALPIRAKGMCNAHYHRALKHGDANADRPISTKIPDGTNWCPNCRTTKPLAEFPKASDRHRAVATYCRECTRELRSTRYKAKIRDQQKRWRDANPEIMAAHYRDYAKRNPEKRAALRRRLVAQKPDLYRSLRQAAENRRRARETDAPGHATATQIQARWDYYGGLCWMCGQPATELEHVKPLAKGGSNWPANLRPACRHCNAVKKDAWPYPTRAQRAA